MSPPVTRTGDYQSIILSILAIPYLILINLSKCYFIDFGDSLPNSDKFILPDTQWVAHNVCTEVILYKFQGRNQDFRKGGRTKKIHQFPPEQ